MCSMQHADQLQQVGAADTQDHAEQQAQPDNGAIGGACPEWIVVLGIKVLIRHRNLHSQSALLKAKVIMGLRLAANAEITGTSATASGDPRGGVTHHTGP